MKCTSVMSSFSTFITERICGAVNNSFDHIAVRQHENYVRFWHLINCESGNMIGGEPELYQLICLS